MQDATIMVIKDEQYIEFSLSDVIKYVLQSALQDANTRNVFNISIYGQNLEGRWKLLEEQWREYQMMIKEAELELNIGQSENSSAIGFPDFWYSKLAYLKMQIIRVIGIHRYQGYPAMKTALMELAKLHGVYDLE